MNNERHLRVAVVFSTAEATRAALKTAGCLARNLGARISLVVPQIVPPHLPLEEPPVAIQFLERRALELVEASGIEADEITAGIYLCRSRNECLRMALKSVSLVVIGGKRSRWGLSKEQTMERFLRTLGHHVVFVEMETNQNAGSLLHRHLRPVLRRVLGFHESL